jgi:hypothetical protein
MEELEDLSSVKINIVELASELANRELNSYADNLSESDYRFEFPNGVTQEDDSDVITYTEEAQDMFNELYDKYYDIVLKTKV